MINSLSPLAKSLRQFKIIPVVVTESISDALKLGEILLENNLPVMEVTFRSAIAAKAIKELKQVYPELCIGAGTILTPAHAQKAQEVGSDFIVSPGFNIETVRACQSLDVPIIPGVNNPTAIEMALNEGIKELKFFPAEVSGGIAMIKALLAPYQDVFLMPTGGIGVHNMKDYLALERVIACGLSWMVDPKLLKEGQWDEVSKRIQLVQQILI